LTISRTIAHLPICPTCGKRCYPKQSQARAAARVMDRQEGVPFSEYQCGGVWHIGKTFKNRFLKAVGMGSKKAAIGIDPGKTGALALVNDEDLVIYDFQSIEAADQALTDLQRQYNIRFAVLEKIWMRKTERNPHSVTQLIRSAAMWDCLLHVHGIPHEEYSPQTWRAGLISGKKTSKAAMVEKARQLLGGSEDDYTRHDRAEAALIAWRAWQHVKSGWKTTKEKLCQD
jgi:Holliday junction resolvasome RuvABC endonuclease subunit